MRRGEKKYKKDDSLYGLLSSYKHSVSYIRILVSEQLKKIEVQLTGNPKNWEKINTEKYKTYKIMRRLEVGVEKLSIKFINPDHLVIFFDPLLGIKIAPEKVTVLNKLDEKDLYIISTSLKYKLKVFQGVKKIINLSPHKKYEILEKSLVKIQDK